MAGRIAQLIGAVTVTALVLSGCTADADRGWLTKPFDAATTGKLSELLTAGGVGVVAKATKAELTKTGRNVVLTQDQVTSMAAQITTRGGTSGAELDDLIPMPPELPPFSFFLAGWARDGDGKGATAARTILGKQNWHAPEAIAWPDAVFSLFLADVTSEQEPSLTPPTLPKSIAPADGVSAALASFDRPGLDVGTLCTEVASFVENSLALVYNAIERAAQEAEAAANKAGGLFGVAGSFIGSIVGTLVSDAVRLFNEVVKGVVDTITKIAAPFLGYLRDALVVIGIVQSISTVLRPWSVALSPQPAAITTGSAAFTARVDSTVKSQGLPDFPQWMKQCASAAGVTLPEPPGPGTALEWDFEPVPAIIAEFDEASSVVGTNGDGRLSYQVQAEDPLRWGGEPFSGFFISVALSPEKASLDSLTPLVDQLISGALAHVSPVISDLVGQVVGQLSRDALRRVADAIGQRVVARAIIPVTFHDFKKEPLKRLPDIIPGSYGQTPVFCAAYSSYLTWLEGHVDYVFDMIGLGEELTVAPEMRSQQATLWATAPASIAAEVRKGYPFGTAGTVPPDVVYDMSAGGDAVYEWSQVYCPPKDRKIAKSYLDWAASLFSGWGKPE